MKRFNNFSSLAEFQKGEPGLSKLENTISIEQQPSFHYNCSCLICSHNTKIQQKQFSQEFLSQISQKDKHFIKIINGLCLPSAPPLKIYIPDVCIVDGHDLSLFQTNPKNCNFCKLPGIFHIRTLFQLMVKLRRQYKDMIGQNFLQNLYKNIDPSFLHQKYLNQLAPTYLHQLEHGRKQTYIVHNNTNLIDEKVEGHKVREYQSFCTIKYKDGTDQIFTKNQFQKLTQQHNTSKTKQQTLDNAILVQSFIKEKQFSQSIFVSTYKMGDEVNNTLFDEAQKQILILSGGMSKYDPFYNDEQDIEEKTDIMMKKDPHKYVSFMTYKIVCYLAMISRIYIKWVKINWTLNDTELIYLHSILELDVNEVCHRSLKYQFPCRENTSHFYKDSKQFIAMCMNIRKNTDKKRRRARQTLLFQRQKSLPFYNQQPQSKTSKKSKQKIDSLHLQPISPNIKINNSLRSSKSHKPRSYTLKKGMIYSSLYV